MDKVYFHILDSKNNDQCVSYTAREDGLLELSMPNCASYEVQYHISMFFALVLDKDEIKKIISKQNKMQEDFRKRVNQMVDKYRKEFDLNFDIKVGLITKARKINDANLKQHGEILQSHLILRDSLQYAPDEIVDRIIRYTIFYIARQYETFYCSDELGEIVDPKYKVPISDIEICKIVVDYKAAVEELEKSLKAYPIKYRQVFLNDKHLHCYTAPNDKCMFGIKSAF